MKKILITSICVCAFALITSSFADSITVNRIEDTYIVMNRDSTPDQMSTLIVEGYDCSACIDQRTILNIDLGAFDRSTTISKAELKLYSPSQPRPGSGIVRVYKMTKSWLPAEANWYNATKSTRWSSPGGDFNSTPRATFKYSSQVNVWHTYDVTSLVQELVAKPDSNFGIMLKMDPMMLTVAYASSNASSDELKPRLVITTAPTSIMTGLHVQNTKLAPIYSISKSQINLTFGNNQAHSILLGDLNGRMVLNNRIVGTNYVIPLNNLNPGRYIIKTNGIEGAHVREISIVK